MHSGYALRGHHFFDVHTATLLVELDNAVLQRKQSEVTTEADVLTRMKLGAYLPH